MISVSDPTSPLRLLLSLSLSLSVAVEPSARKVRRSPLPSDKPFIAAAGPGMHALLGIELSQARLPTVWIQGIRPQQYTDSLIVPVKPEVNNLVKL